MSSKRESLANAFIHHMIYVRRLSVLTGESYSKDIRALFAQLQKDELEQVQAQDIRLVIARLHGKGLSGRSLARMLSAWRCFYKYLIREQHCEHNPCVGLHVPKSAQKLPNVLSPDQAMQLLAFPSDNILNVRDSAIFELFYSSGLRLAELTHLKQDDIRFSEGTVRVLGKGGKMRIVPVGDYAIRAIRCWLEQRPSIAKPDTRALFVSRRGDAMSARTISYRLKNRGIKQGIHQNIHPHILRHSFASHVLQSSGDLRAVQEMLGHAHITSTQVYTHLDYQHLAKIYDKAHPRAKKRS